MKLRAFRRRLALFICPELHPENWTTSEGRLVRQDPLHVNYALEVQLLDRTLTSHFGVPLEWRDIKPERGKPARSGGVSERDAYAAITTLRRLRPGPLPTLGEKAHFYAVALLSAIWPVDLDWPQSVTRITINKKDAA